MDVWAIRVLLVLITLLSNLEQLQHHVVAFAVQILSTVNLRDRLQLVLFGHPNTEVLGVLLSISAQQLLVFELSVGLFKLCLLGVFSIP